MTKLEFEKVIIPLIKYIDGIEMDLIVNILDRIDNYDGVKGSLKWYTDKLSELKLLDKDNLKVFKKDKDKLKRIVSQLAEDCGYHIENLDKLNEYYEKGLLNKNPLELYENVAINRLINDAIKDTTSIMDLIQTKAIEGSNKAYMDILNQAYVETASGTYTYTEAIRKALDKFAEQGIKAAHYKNGTSLSIESVTRRDVITRMNKLNGDVEIENAKELGTNLVYVDQHLGARVRTKYTKEDYEAHAEWQGKKYMIVGSNDKYDNLYEKTGYGEMLGLKGINCYHNMRPTWEWEKIDEQINLIENAKVRTILDKKNYYARKVRCLKHKRLNAKVLNDKEEYKKINKQLSSLNREYNNWLEENNLTRDYNREHVSSSKETSNNYLDVTKEWLDTATPNSHIVQDRHYFEKDNVKYQVDGENVVLDYSNKEKEVAEWLENTFGGEIYLLPRVNNPEGIQTADYLFRGECWDLKKITSKSKQALYHSVYKKKKQSNNFIFDITNSDLTLDNIKQQINNLYKRKDCEFINKIIIKKDNIFLIYRRK